MEPSTPAVASQGRGPVHERSHIALVLQPLAADPVLASAATSESKLAENYRKRISANNERRYPTVVVREDPRALSLATPGEKLAVTWPDLT